MQRINRSVEVAVFLLQPCELGLEFRRVLFDLLMQCIDRRVEVAVFLLQSCELGLEFALIFVGHGVLNRKRG